MASLRRELVELEDERANALSLAGHAFWPGADFWHTEAARLERVAADIRSRVLEAMK